MESARIDRKFMAKMERSLMFRTLARIFEERFRRPLFLESCHGPGRRIPHHQTPYCLAVHSPRASCAGCPLSRYSDLGSLEPKPHSFFCDAGLAIALAPVKLDGTAGAWLITGQAKIGDVPSVPRDIDQKALGAGMVFPAAGDLELLHQAAPRIPLKSHQRAHRFLDAAGEILDAGANSLLTQINDLDSPSVTHIKMVIKEERRPAGSLPESLIALFVRETQMEPSEFELRCRVERTRRRILAGAADQERVHKACQETGFQNFESFENAFAAIFHEMPLDHCRRMKATQRRLVDSLLDT